MRLILVLLSLFALFPLAAEAKIKTCKTMIDGQEQTLSYQRGDDAMQENRSTREWLFGRYGKVSCPGYITLRALTPGAGGELQLTDAIAALLAEEAVLAYPFKGKRYDCGSKLGYLQATVELARKHPEVGAAFSAWLDAQHAAAADAA